MQHDEPADPIDALSDKVASPATEADRVASAQAGNEPQRSELGSEMEPDPALPIPSKTGASAELSGADAVAFADAPGGDLGSLVNATALPGPRSAPGSSGSHGSPSGLAPTRTTDAVMGLLIIVATFVSSMMFSLWARDAALASPAPAPGPPLRDLPGFPGEVAPFELLPEARNLAVRQLFMGFVAEGIRADGTLDLSQKDNHVRFAFQDQRGRGPQPYREGGTLPGRTFCGKQNVEATKRGMVAKEDQPKVPCPHAELRELPQPATCQIRDVWRLAKRHKFRLNKPARLEYFRSAGGPAFRLVQKDKKSKTLSLVVSARDCQSVLTGKQQRGSVP